MKKMLFLLVIATALLLVFCACGGSKKPAVTTAATTTNPVLTTVVTTSGAEVSVPATSTSGGEVTTPATSTSGGEVTTPTTSTSGGEVTVPATTPLGEVTTVPVTSTSALSTKKDPVSVEPLSDLLYPAFETPSAKMTSKPLWFWNTSLENITEEEIREIVRRSYLESGYSGMGILPFGVNNYLSEDYFKLYGAALDEGEKYGMEFILYDENGFPSFNAGGLFGANYPDLTAKRLDMTESSRVRDGKIFLKIPQGTFMGAVAWNTKTNEMINISDKAVLIDTSLFDPSRQPIGAVASSTFNQYGNYGVSQVFDGNFTTRWNAYSNSGNGSYILVAYEKAITLDEVRIYEDTNPILHRVKEFTVECYDEEKAEWHKLASGTTITNKGAKLSFDAVSTRFVRFVFDKITGDSATISEIEMYAGGKKLASPPVAEQKSEGGKVSSSSDYSSDYTADKAFDGSYTSRWNSADSQRDNQWLLAEFGKEVTIDSVIVYEALGRISSFRIEYLDNGTWKTCHSGNTIGEGGKRYAFEPVTTTAMRFYIASTQNGPSSIYEIEFYNGENEILVQSDEDYYGSYLEYPVSDNNWKLMAFVTVRDGANGMDYLSKESVGAFIELTYDAYYKHFQKYFENGTISYAFYDEPTWRMTSGWRAWTASFNEAFAEMFGDTVDPILYYPAMFYDIGEKTTEARDRINAVRTEMYAKNYVGQMNEWCRQRGIELMGHMLDDDAENPVGLHGDLMYCFVYQDIPTVDVIFYYDMTKDYIKVVSSSAYNWDKALVGVEAYGGFGADMSVDYLYKQAMDLYAKGINFMVPHALWYDTANNIPYPPELSYRNPKYADALKVYNDYIARLNTVLQQGRHIADVAVLYPIDTLEDAYFFNGTHNNPTYSNYSKIGEALSETLRIDFTYLHPSVLNEKVSLKGNTLHLDNKVNYEDYKVMILPAMEVIDLQNLQKIKAFYEAGGTVISVGTLPTKGTLAKDDAAVKAIIAELFGSASVGNLEKTNQAGGKLFHITSVSSLSSVMKKACTLYDVNIAPMTARNGHLTYIHKAIADRDVWFFANSTDKDCDTSVTLRGEYHELEVWDPMTGKREDLAVTVKDGATSFVLSLDKISSCFVIEKVK